MTKDKAKYLKRILAVKELREGFDDLLDIIDLWDGFCIGTMRRYLSLNCHEVTAVLFKRWFRADIEQELSTYLRFIRRVWSQITNSNNRLMNLVDTTMVKFLKLKTSAVSERDANFAKICMDIGKIFAQVLDSSLKKTIINNICAVERIIFFFRTFLEDIKHLELYAQAVKMLLETQNTRTIYQDLYMNFVGSSRDQKHIVRQNEEDHFVRIERRDINHFEFNYKQLWIYAMHHFSGFVSADVKEGSKKDPPCIKKPISIL